MRRPAGSGRGRQRLVGRRPVAEPFGELAPSRGRLRFAEAPYRMAGADHPVQRRGADAGRQARHPARDDVAPRRVLELLDEQRGPVGDAIRPTEHGLPCVAPDPLTPRRRRQHSGPVPLEPRHHRVGPSDRGERLDDHRGVTGEPVPEVGAVACQHLERRLHHRVVGHACGVRITIAGWRASSAHPPGPSSRRLWSARPSGPRWSQSRLSANPMPCGSTAVTASRHTQSPAGRRWR